MIGFLQPLLALAALAAAVPILLHLIRRREQRRVVFPAIRYLRRAEERYARRLRLRHLLLLAARVLIVLLLAVAAAGPLIGRGSPTDHEPTAVALVLDESLSVGRLAGDRRLIDEYTQRGRLAVELTASEDRIALFSGARPEESATVEGVEAVRRALEEAQPTAGMADPAGALQAATAWLRSSGLPHREVHLFSDLQAVSLPTDPATTDPTTGESERGRGVSVIAYSGGIETEVNAAPGAPQPVTLPLDAGLPTRVSVPIDWWGEAAPPETMMVVRMWVDAAVVAVGEARLGETAILGLPPRDSGWVQGYVEIDTYGLAADDRHHFTWFSRPPPAVAVVGDPGDFVARALATLERGERLRTTGRGSANVVLAVGGEGLETPLGPGQSAIVIPPADPLDLPRLNSRLARADLPWRYGIAEDDAGASRIAGADGVAGLDGMEVRWSYEIERSALAADDSALLRLEVGTPWLLRGTHGEDNAYLLLGSPLIPEASELPVSAAMVPFIDALLGDWARRPPADKTDYSGVARVQLPPRAEEIRMPDGSLRGVEGGSPFVAVEPGNYRVIDGTRTLRAFSVNAPARESDLRPGVRARLEAALPAADWLWPSGQADDDWRNAIFRERRGRHVWRPLVLLLLALAIVEGTLAAAGRRRAGRAEAAAEAA